MSDRTPPDLAAECPNELDSSLRDDLRRALRERHADRLGVDERGVALALDVDAMTGQRAAVAVVVTGTVRRAHEVFAFTRATDPHDGDAGLEGPLGVVVDYLDGLLDELIAADDGFLPLDWEGRPYSDGGRRVAVFVRGEVRDYVAEEEAARLLQEEPLARAIPGFPLR